MEKDKQIEVIKNKLEQMKKIGIKKVELLCVDNCECCKKFKNKQIDIADLVTLPMENCPYNICRGLFVSGDLKFDLTGVEKSNIPDFDIKIKTVGIKNGKELIMDKYVVKKHWWYWANPVVFSILLCWTIILPIFILGGAFLRWKLDKIEIENGCLNSRLGVFFIDKKSIPLNQISYIGEKTDLISQWLGFGTIEVKSSAFAEDISYMYIEKPQELIKFINENKSIK